jgi:hypothetical protein
MIKIKYSFHLLVVEGHYKDLQAKEVVEEAVEASKEVLGQDQGTILIQVLGNCLLSTYPLHF